MRVGCLPIEDKQALIDLISGVENLPLDWNINDIDYACDWTGVQCTLPLKDCIQIISLENLALFGILNESIGKTRCLTSLYLANNHLYGPIPASIFNNSYIYIFDLANNAFTSTLPEVGEGQTVSYLNISGNKLSGCVPASYNQLQWGIEKYSYCDVRSNYFDCSIDYCTNALPVFCLKGCESEPSSTTVTLMITEIFLIAFATFVLGMLVAAFIVFMYTYYRKEEKKHDKEYQPI